MYKSAQQERKQTEVNLGKQRPRHTSLTWHHSENMPVTQKPILTYRATARNPLEARDTQKLACNMHAVLWRSRE